MSPVSLFFVTTSVFDQWVICVPAAFRRSGSRFSGFRMFKNANVLFLKFLRMLKWACWDLEFWHDKCISWVFLEKNFKFFFSFLKCKTKVLEPRKTKIFYFLRKKFFNLIWDFKWKWTKNRKFFKIFFFCLKMSKLRSLSPKNAKFLNFDQIFSLI